MTVLVLSHSLLSFSLVYGQPLLLSTVNQESSIFCFGFTCELLGVQIIYVLHPFLTAHFNDYSVFEFS